MSSRNGLEFAESCLGCKLSHRESFCFLPKPSLAAFEKIKCTIVLPRGSTLFVAGQDPTGLYVVCSGKVKVWTTGPTGRIIVVKIATAGDVLGLHACVVRSQHEFTAETVQPSEVSFAKTEDFLSLLRRDSALCWKAAQVLGRQCREILEFRRSLHSGLSASEKLARLLLDLSATWQANDNSARGNVELSQGELAQVIGMSRETVWRKLCEFRDRGVAVLQRSTLLIHDRQELKRLAGR